MSSFENALKEILESDDIYFDGYPKEIVVKVYFEDGTIEHWNKVSIINHISQIDGIHDLNNNYYHKLSKIKEQGIINMEVQYTHQVFGFTDE